MSNYAIILSYFFKGRNADDLINKMLFSNAVTWFRHHALTVDNILDVKQGGRRDRDWGGYECITDRNVTPHLIETKEGSGCLIQAFLSTQLTHTSFLYP